MSDDVILEFKNVTKKFPGITALDDVSFSIRRGEIHGICGEMKDKSFMKDAN